MKENGSFSWGAQLLVCVPLLVVGVMLVVL